MPAGVEDGLMGVERKVGEPPVTTYQDPKKLSYQATNSYHTLLRTERAAETNEQNTHPRKTRPDIRI